MIASMSALERITITIHEETLAAARLAAERDGVSLSAWLSRAAEHVAGLEAMRQGIAEHEAEHGQIPSTVQAEVDLAWDQIGIGAPETPEQRRHRLGALARFCGIDDAVALTGATRAEVDAALRADNDVTGIA